MINSPTFNRISAIVVSSMKIMIVLSSIEIITGNVSKSAISQRHHARSGLHLVMHLPKALFKVWTTYNSAHINNIVTIENNRQVCLTVHT